MKIQTANPFELYSVRGFNKGDRVRTNKEYEKNVLWRFTEYSHFEGELIDCNSWGTYFVKLDNGKVEKITEFYFDKV